MPEEISLDKETSSLVDRILGGAMLRVLVGATIYAGLPKRNSPH